MLVALMGQLPNVLIQVLLPRHQRAVTNLLDVAAQPGAAWLVTASMIALAALGLLRAYRDTLRFYRGGDAIDAPRGFAVDSMREGPPIGTRHPTAEPAVPAARRGRPRLVERGVPGLPDPAAAVATATCRSMLRAPEVAMNVGVSLMLSCLLCGMMILRFGADIAVRYRPLVVECAMAFSAFMLLPFLCNQFGFDRDGFRALVLSPVDRRLILLGKNVAGMSIGAAACLPVLALWAITLHVIPWAVAAALLQMTAILLIATTIGNVLSIFLPYRVAAGSLRASGLPASSLFAVVVCQLASPVFFAPAFIPPLVASALPSERTALPALLDLGLSLAIAAGVAKVYALSLGLLGPKLKRREDLVLQRVTAEYE
jgi:hypothetical protein